MIRTKLVFQKLNNHKHLQWFVWKQQMWDKIFGRYFYQLEKSDLQFVRQIFGIVIEDAAINLNIISPESLIYSFLVLLATMYGNAKLAVYSVLVKAKGYSFCEVIHIWSNNRNTMKGSGEIFLMIHVKIFFCISRSGSAELSSWNINEERVGRGLRQDIRSVF